MLIECEPWGSFCNCYNCCCSHFYPLVSAKSIKELECCFTFTGTGYVDIVEVASSILCRAHQVSKSTGKILRNKDDF